MFLALKAIPGGPLSLLAVGKFIFPSNPMHRLNGTAIKNHIFSGSPYLIISINCGRVRLSPISMTISFISVSILSTSSSPLSWICWGVREVEVWKARHAL